MRQDLENLRDRYMPSMGDIIETDGSDYRFRVIVDRHALSRALAETVNGIDYSNFKSAVAERQGWKRADRYHDVWAALYGLQEQRDSRQGW